MLVTLTATEDAESKRGNGLRRSGQPPERAVVKGRLVVKYRDSVRMCVHCLLAARRSFADASAVEGKALQALHERFQVRSARPVFRSIGQEYEALTRHAIVPTAELRRLHLERQLSVLDRFPERPARIGRGASLPELHHVYVLDLPSRHDPGAVAAAFERDPNVEYAHPDLLVRTTHVPDDPYYHSVGSWGQAEDDLWGLKSDQLDMERAWDATQGEGMVVAVVDTGVDYRHPDLAANMWSNPGEEPGNGIDDDGNGLVDDLRGWDFTTCARFRQDGTCNQPKARDSDPRDDHFHGTHVAGTVAAVGDNGKGIVGVAPRTKVMAVKALNSQGAGTAGDLAAALVYAASSGADVLNNSWSCGFCPEVPLFEDAVRTVHGFGALSVFAAGNSGLDSRVSSPQNLRRPKPLVVAASDPGSRPTSFTNFGAAIDVSAPGGGGGRADVLSLKTGDGCRGRCRGRTVGGKYLRLQGTSMAAPHAAGLAALVLARSPGLSPDAVRQVLRGSSDDVGPAGFDLRSGSGRLDAPQAVQTPGPLEVEIERPANGAAKRGGRVQVSVTTRGGGFVSARLYAAREEDIGREAEGGWRQVRGPWSSPATGRSLGKVPLRSGWNLLRLEATTADGRRYSDVVSFGRQGRHRRIGAELPGLAVEPDVDGRRVVWIQLEPGSLRRGNVYLGELRGGDVARLTEETGEYYSPRISGDTVVWQDGSGGGRDRLSACFYDESQRRCSLQVVDDQVRGLARPEISGQRVLYSQDTALVAVDLANGARQGFASELEGPVTGWDIDGDRAVWAQRTSGGTTDLKVFDWTTGQIETLSSSDPSSSGPSVLGVRLSGELLAYWVVVEEELAFELRTVRLGQGAERVLDRRRTPSGHFDVAAGRVVWSRGSDVLVHDHAMDASWAQVLHPLIPRTAPRVSGRQLVWIDVVEGAVGSGHVRTTRIR